MSSLTSPTSSILVSPAFPSPSSPPSVLTQFASSQADILTDYFKAFKTYKRGTGSNAFHLSLSYIHSSMLSPSFLHLMFDLTKQNMETQYNACQDWGWSDKKKMDELTHSNARFIVVMDEQQAESAMEDENKQWKEKVPIAFAHIRFEVECSHPVCYLYELQVNSNYQKRGIGKYLMQLTELIAWKFHLTKVVLTVFKYNTSACHLYRESLKYAIDEDDPNDEEAVDYWILSKKNKKLLEIQNKAVVEKFQNAKNEKQRKEALIQAAMS
jgi:ribosomal protein S18 acetylase RimI-like enzyme